MEKQKIKYPPRPDRMKAIIADSILANGDMLGALDILNKDLKEASKLMSKDEIRYFVGFYYDIQQFRIATENRIDELAYPKADKQGFIRQPVKPSDFMVWYFKNLQLLEKQIHTMLDKWSSNQPMGVWARNIVGIGPVFSSGLLAHISIEKAPTVGHIWRYAGLDPTSKWLKGQKRPWNAELKKLCWLMGESFVKVQSNDKDIYGKLYAQRYAYEMERNDRGEFQEEARLRGKEINASYDASHHGTKINLKELLSQGFLPDKGINERAKRWAVKQFLSDWHAAAYKIILGKEPPPPYPIAHMGHTHWRTVEVKST